MRIAPRTLMCGSLWRTGGTVADTGFDELRDLTAAADDKVSLAIGMSGRTVALRRACAVSRSCPVGLGSRQPAGVDRRSDADAFTALCRPCAAKFADGRDSRGDAAEHSCASTLPMVISQKETSSSALPWRPPLRFAAWRDVVWVIPEWESDFDEAVSIASSACWIPRRTQWACSTGMASDCRTDVWWPMTMTSR